MTAHDTDNFARADRTAEQWLDTVAEQLGTDDRHYAYRVLRAWLRTVRDRLTVDAAAHFSAQLPVLLRGLFFDGWMPAHVPVKYDAEQFLLTVAQEARVSMPEARRAAPAVTDALARHCSPGQLDHLLAQLPAELRLLLERAEPEPAAEPAPAPAPAAGAGAAGRAAPAPAAAAPEAGPAEALDRIERVERDMRTVAEAVRVLVHGLEDLPAQESRPERTATAARRAHDILLTLPGTR